MTSSEQVKMLREMANGQDKLAKHYARVPNLSAVFTGKSDALNAGAEALEAMLPKQTSADTPSTQKAEILSALADSADALAKLDCGLIDRAGMAQRAALFRECAAMMRERGAVEWDAEGGATKNGLHLFAGPVLSGFMSLVTKQGQTLHMDWHPTLEAARAAAIAWVEGQEGE